MNKSSSRRYFIQAFVICLGFVAATVSHADQNLAGNVTVTGGTTTGNLNVTGSLDVDGPVVSFGTIGTSTVGNSLIFSDSSATSGTTGDTLTFSANRTSASWLWLHNASKSAMRLNSLHQLLLYQADGSTVGITLTPVSNQLSLGTATLTGSGTTLTAGAGLTVTGAFTASSGITNTSGTLTGGSTGLNLSAGGTNQNISLNSSGTGDLVFNTNGVERARIKSSGNVGIGTNAPAERLDLGTGNLKSSGWALLNGGYYNSTLSVGWGPGDGSYFSIRTGGFDGRFNVASNGNVGIGTTNPNEQLEVASSTGGRLILSDGGAGSRRALVFQGPTSTYNYAMIAGYSYGGGTYVPITMQPNGGNVGIGTTTPQASLQVVGKVLASGGFACDNETFTDTTNTVFHYGLCWADFSGGTLGPSAMLSGYGGVNLYTAGQRSLTVSAAGNVGIGTTNPTQKLSVAGTIRAYAVIVDTGWSDYVFGDNYRLAPLSEVESHIKAEKHLPGIPSAAEVAEHGVSLGDMQSKLLAKVEELTLHLIAQEKRMAAQQDEIVTLRKELGEFRAASGSQ